MKSKTKACPLCKSSPDPNIIYADQFVWISKCELCNLPMLVWRDHRKDLGDMETLYIMKLAEAFYPLMKYKNSVCATSEHYHAHVEDS